MDCIHCLLPTRAIRTDDEVDDEDISIDVRNLSSSDVYSIQTSARRGVPRNVTKTVSAQITVAQAALSVGNTTEPPNPVDFYQSATVP
eukprot:IDg19109t1